MAKQAYVSGGGHDQLRDAFPPLRTMPVVDVAVKGALASAPKGPELADMWAAASAALDFIGPGTKVVGLGSGRTIQLFAAAIKDRLQELGRRPDDIVCVCTSGKTEDTVRKSGVAVAPLDEFLKSGRRVELYVDGLDRVGPDARSTKGGGRAVFREKELRVQSDTFVAIAAKDKIQGFDAFPLPIVVDPVVLGSISAELRRVLKPAGEGLELNVWAESDGKPKMTEDGFNIIDVHQHRLSRLSLADLQALERSLDVLPGVKAHGIFSLDNTRPQAVLIGRDGKAEYYFGGPPGRTRPKE